MLLVRLIALPAVIAPGGCAVETQRETIRFLLVVREWLLPDSDAAYNQNELQIAAACATWKCPHPYLALASTAVPKEVWWLNAFASAEERDELDRAYARNERLMSELRPLGKRKEAFRQALTSTLTEYQPDLSGGARLEIEGARFMVVSIDRNQRAAAGAVFQSATGEQFTIATAGSSTVAERIAARAGPGTVVLAVQPRWSFPADSWVAADPDFWHSNPVARQQRAARNRL